MKLTPNISSNQIFSIQAILVLLFCIHSFHAQSNTSDSFNDLRSGDTLYVVTNRTVDSTREDLYFSNQVNENASLVYLSVTLNESEETVSHALTYDDFMTQVCLKTSDWLLFVHGDSKTYEQSVKRGFKIQKTHNINVIVFSWPSKVKDLTGLKNLNNSKRNVLKSMHHFNELLSFMDVFKKSNKAFEEQAKLSMLLHSLGNLYLENIVNDATEEIEHEIIFENIIINSAAVNQKKHKAWVEKIALQKRIYITNNKSDFNLKGLHIFSRSGNQLGEKAKLPIAKNANYVQFSKAVGFRFPTGTTHTYFIGNIPNESENIRSFYSDSFHGLEIDFSQQNQFILSKKGVGFDIVF
ncbi:alpha/beta hydrolase [Crocinitomix catalasitica]|uniref:alpha/beta hydrolase n=1 Tax=Crocinitomix catalasitica TaxID=184607 RepID=UPI000480E3CA|nr:alpha/beta hydrolase [Crocinitomix catalasitica]